MGRAPTRPRGMIRSCSSRLKAALSAAILQPVSVAPASAAGGQIVTQKIKFGRKEERSLRVVVLVQWGRARAQFCCAG